jgi:two-component SAPR family response regulator
MKVLIVDDEQFILNTLERFIKRIGHEPIATHEGARAVELYKILKPDIVLLDLMLPDKKGSEVYREIMEFDKKANIVFITGSFAEYSRIEELNKPQCFVKPISIMRIKEIIELHEPNKEALKSLEDAGMPYKANSGLQPPQYEKDGNCDETKS